MKNLMSNAGKTIYEIANFPINVLQEYSKTKKEVEKLLIELRSLDNLFWENKIKIKEVSDTNSKLKDYLPKEEYKEITRKIYRDFWSN